MRWTEDQDAELKRLAPDLSAAQIGARFGVSRNAVIGRLHRLKVALPQKAQVRPKPEPITNARPAPSRRATGVAVPERLASAVMATPVPVSLPATIQMRFSAAVEADRCLFFAGDPYGPDGPDMPVCGAERSLLSRYCGHHIRLQCQPKAAA